MQAGFKRMADAMEDANANFIALVMELTGMDVTKAENVLTVYKKLGVVKRDLTNRTYNVKTGDLLDVDVLNCASIGSVKNKRFIEG